MQELMKKIVYAIAALALIFTGCAKELENTTKDNFSKVRLHVKVADQMTKVSADNDGRYHWQAGDQITVFNDSEDPFTFSTEQGGSDVDFGATSWSGNLGKYAMYPASDDHVVSGNEIVFNLPSSFVWAENSTNMPMLGKISGDVATFKAVGGVLKLVCYNIPAGAAKLWFVSSSSKITGDFEIADASIANPVIASESATDDVLEITFAYSANKVFYIPLPTGEIDGFEVYFYDSSDTELFSKTTDASFTVGRNKMIIAPALDCTGVADALLTNDEILASTIESSYGTGSISSASGAWNYSACKQSYTAISKTYIQIRNNATVSYLQLPSFSNNIASITLHNIANGSNGAYTGTVYFRDEASNDADPIASATCDVDAREDFVLNIPSGNTTGYIMSSGPCRFYAVTVKFVNAGTFPSLTATDDDLEIAVGSLTATTTVSLSNPVDALGISCVVNEEAKSWLSASISGSTLTVTAAEANSTATDRDGTVSLKATGAANVVISVTQPTKIVANPTVTATAGDSKFTATWAGVPHASNYVAYLHTAPTATPATGGTNITASISESAGTYSITDYAVTNDTHYYLYVKVNEVDSNYEAVSEYTVVDFTPAEAKGTVENPYTVSEALSIISGLPNKDDSRANEYTRGIISSISKLESDNSITYSISEDGTTSDELKAYKGNNIGNVAFDAITDLEVGDEVVIYGQLYNYNSTAEINAGNYITSRTRVHKVVVEPNEDILMAGAANSVYTMTITTNYAWTAELNSDATAARGTSFAVLNSSDEVIASTISGPAGTTTIKFKALGDGNADGSTVTNYGTITFSDGTVSSNAIKIKQSPKSSATEHVATINFGSATGSTKIQGSSSSGTGTVTYTDTGNDSEGNTWTITTVSSKTKSFTQNASYSQVGASKNPVTSITFTTTLDASATDISLRAKFGGFSDTAGTVTLKVGDTSIGTGSLSGTSDVTVTSSGTGSGTVLTVTVTGIAKGVKVYWIEATYTN